MMREDGEVVRAKAILDEEQYASADRAHMNAGYYVRVSGCLSPGRQPRTITNLTAFELIEPSVRQM